jgi:hypothetical protein
MSQEVDLESCLRVLNMLVGFLHSVGLFSVCKFLSCYFPAVLYSIQISSGQLVTSSLDVRLLTMAGSRHLGLGSPSSWVPQLPVGGE